MGGRSLRCVLGQQQRFAVDAARCRLAGDHAGIASQLLVVAESARGEVQQGVEPEQATQRRGERIGMQVATGNVHALVGKHQRALAGVVTGVEIGRQHDRRTQPAHRRGQAGTGLCLQAFLAWSQLAEAAAKPALRGRQQCQGCNDTQHP